MHNDGTETTHTYALDIETCAWAPGVERRLAQPFYPRANLKDEKKKAADVERQKHKAAADAALSPLTGQVALVTLTDETGVQTFDVDLDLDESAVLSAVAAYCSTAKRVVTFNGTSFDLPFLRARAMACGVRLPACLTDTRRYSPLHLDLREVLTGGDRYGKGKLEDWCFLAGIEAIPTPMPNAETAGTFVPPPWDPDAKPEPGRAVTGADIPGLIEAGEWDAVREYAADDGLLTWALYQALRQAGVVT